MDIVRDNARLHLAIRVGEHCYRASFCEQHSRLPVFAVAWSGISLLFNMPKDLCLISQTFLQDLKLYFHHTYAAVPITCIPPSADSRTRLSQRAQPHKRTGWPANGTSSFSVNMSRRLGMPGPGASCKNTVSEKPNSFAINCFLAWVSVLPRTATIARRLPLYFSALNTYILR